MKNFRITALILALLLTFSACSKETRGKGTTRRETQAEKPRAILTADAETRETFDNKKASIPANTTKQNIDTEMNNTSIGTSTVSVYNETADLERTAVEVIADFEALDVPLAEEVQRAIYKYTQAYGIDLYTVYAIIEHESGYNAAAVSASNDYGLMQINAIHFNTFQTVTGISDMLDPIGNVEFGIYLLADINSRIAAELTGDARTRALLMAYQFGEYGASLQYKQGVYSTSFTEAVITRAASLRKERR